MKRVASFALLVLSFVLFAHGPVYGQGLDQGVGQDNLDPRFGLGFNTAISTEDGLGVGLRLRGSSPINADLSFAVDLGVTGFIFGGRDEATYLVDPQVSAIVSVPQGPPNRLTYFLGGLGAYIPFETNAENPEAAPTLHFGIGRVELLTDTSIFYEVNPALIIGEERVGLLLPIRAGVIF